MLRVGLDASASAVAKPTGVAVAIRGLALALGALPAAEEIELTPLYRLSRVKRRSTFLPGAKVFHPRFSLLLARKLDVIHGPDARLPKLRGPSLVATIHDLSVRKDGRFSEPGFRETRARHWEDAAARADRIVVYTEAVKRDVTRELSFPAERISVVPLAASGKPRGGTAKRDHVLVLGEISTRKNTLGAVLAFERARERSPAARRTTLLLVGPDGHGAEAVHEAIRGREHVRHVGWLPAAELAETLETARALLFPSRSEGFGLPVLEAMQASVPVIASNDPALVEVAGGAALHADSEDVAGLAAHLVTVLEGGAQELGSRGRARAAEFTWERSARALASVYRAARSAPCRA
ncbi:MAG TPA: glycosyltransferase family 1 protein [Planctomycetota bacterium]|nr:glycosyltransferase family 1 protein [Planctomycetota bacterium]